jgi:mRNA export factor
MNYTNSYNNEDYLIPVLIEDTVQCLKFFPSKDINYLASGGWDSKLRLFEINYQIMGQNSNKDIVKIFSEPKNTCKHQSPILSLTWEGSSGALITGCIDGSINYVDCQKNIFTKLGEHNGGCKEVLYVENYIILLTGGYDGTVKIWDLKSKNPVTSYQFYNKVYSMDYSRNLFVVALSENVMAYFNLDNLQKNIFEPELIYSSHIKSQIKKVLVINDGNGYLEGSIEGRIAVKYINFYTKPSLVGNDNFGIETKNEFAFKCHREIRQKENLVQTYPINDMCVNPVYGSVVSAGGNGKYYIWDIGEKSKINERDNFSDKTPLTAVNINRNGTLLAYASGYDWSKGAKFANLYTRPKIFIHYLQKEHRKSKNY